MEAGSVVESDWRGQNENKILDGARITGTNKPRLRLDIPAGYGSQKSEAAPAGP
jgi:hypothetical protein